MIASCSAWMVATMSRMPSPRGALTADSSATSLEVPGCSPASSASGLPNTSSVKSSRRRPRLWNCLRLRMFSGCAPVAV